MRHYLNICNQGIRTSEAQYVTETEALIEDFFCSKIKAIPHIDLLWSERFSEIKTPAWFKHV